MGGLAPGSVLLEKYRVEAQLGRGGMGVVVRARHLMLDEVVAIKILREDIERADDATRFVREAQAAARLKGPHVVRVSDVGLASGVPYMVMELLEGEDLGERLQRSRVPTDEAVDLIVQACAGLAEAHAAGIVHRDIKPTNLFVTRDDDGPLVKVLDFGISKIAAADLALTQTQSMLGTPAYMSPEQMRSARSVDHRSDIWSIGAVLYEIIEGERPFAAETFTELVLVVASEPPRPPTRMSPELAAVVMRSLAKAPADRYATIGELAAALVPFASDRARAAALVERMKRRLCGFESSPSIPLSDELAAIAQTVADPAPPARWRRPLLVFGGVALASAAALGVVVLAHRDPPASHTAAPPPAPAAAAIVPPPPPPPEPPAAVPVDAGVVPVDVVREAKVRPSPPPPPRRTPTKPPSKPCSGDPYASRKGC